MKTVGQILKEAREAKLLTLGDVEKHTKIRIELLEALEADNYAKLPPSTFVQGFIKNYGKFLNLNGEKLLAIFRRDFEAKKHPPIVLDSFANPLAQNKFRLTPPRILGLIVGIIIISFFTYLWFEYRQFIGPPNLELSSPQDQISVDIPTVTVDGKTDPEVKVMVNNQEITVDQNGHFRQDVKLSSPVNTIEVVATGKFGQSAKVDRTVVVKK